MNDVISPALVLILVLAMYVLMAMPLYTIGEKTGSDHSWFAFVPILNLVLMLEVAGKELWWILLMFIPCINIFVLVMIWMGVAEAMDKPSWIGVLMLVPVLNILVPFYIAYG